jgi:biopolymer transport protein ExbD
MSSLRTPLPERKRSYRIALMPLADAMFQLLIFFMLTTSLTPYSLITIRTGEAAPTEEQETNGTGAGSKPSRPSQIGRTSIWLVNEGIVSAKGQDYETGQLLELAKALGNQDDPGSVVIVVGVTARVQDVTMAMEALRNADITSVQITRDGG